MNELEAKVILQNEVQACKTRSYSELVEDIGRPRTEQRTSPSGTIYQIEIQALWDDKPGNAIRIIACIDDGTPRAFRSPLSDDFIMTPDGFLVGE